MSLGQVHFGGAEYPSEPRLVRHQRASTKPGFPGHRCGSILGSEALAGPCWPVEIPMLEVSSEICRNRLIEMGNTIIFTS